MKLTKLQQEIIDYAGQKTGVEVDLKREWDAHRGLLAEKMFLMLGTDKTGEPILTVKLKPEHGDFLRIEHPETVLPGYYMNKVHWNSIYLKKEKDTSFLFPLIDESYDLIFSSLSKKKQLELTEEI